VKILEDVGLDAARALKLAAGMLGVALLLGGSLLGVLVAGAAAVPAAYVMWLGAQEETQRTYLYGLLLFLASLALAVILLLRWLF
jgi:hypothetical protein